MVRADLAARKIARAAAWLDEAEAILARPEAEYLADRRGRDLAAFYLFLAVQECIDLAAHWVADAGWQPPDDAASTFDLLADRGAIDAGLAGGMRAAVGLRNRVAHGYALLDHARLRTESAQGLGVIRKFLDRTAKAAGL